jgi:hypothetical protein
VECISMRSVYTLKRACLFLSKNQKNQAKGIESEITSEEEDFRHTLWAVA